MSQSECPSKTRRFASAPLISSPARLGAQKLLAFNLFRSKAGRTLESIAYSVVFRGSGAGDGTGSMPRQSRS